MARFNPKSFAQPDLLKKIQVRNLLELLSPHQAFLEAMGLPFSTDGNDGFDYLKLAGILAQPDEAMDSSLVEALHVIGNLGTDESFDERRYMEQRISSRRNSKSLPKPAFARSPSDGPESDSF